MAAPLGIGAAIFMTDIAPSWGRKIMQPIVELLVGIPSVVYGFIGLTVLVPFIQGHILPAWDSHYWQGPSSFRHDPADHYDHRNRCHEFTA